MTISDISIASFSADTGIDNEDSNRRNKQPKKRETDKMKMTTATTTVRTIGTKTEGVTTPSYYEELQQRLSRVTAYTMPKAYRSYDRPSTIRVRRGHIQMIYDRENGVGYVVDWAAMRVSKIKRVI